ncbi:hypothetical protein N2K95_15715 [Arthrobacter zhaoxinii]|uniref:Uncharacterized protein n=1 Tax=Arthrobacter zhaoxinii TaxID=2964616 RepID=A0ABY5YTR3_9MICC|nr:hypothetical protein [Arthrobacter zhaoxinii]UWX97050.1 hypothetical protein N2K95_15715 [Arthrobacter zhaoxinii]
MEQTLLSLLSRRTAWILLAACTVFWLVLAAGFLEAPMGTPPTLMFLWMYSSLMIALASAPVAAAAVAALVLHRAEDRAEPGETDAAGAAAPEQPHESRSLYLLLQRQFKKQQQTSGPDS